MSLPVQRELADMYIKCGDVMLEMFQVHAKETRAQQLEDLRKGSVVKVTFSLKYMQQFQNTHTSKCKSDVETVYLLKANKGNAD